jgi:hypothetical protein
VRSGLAPLISRCRANCADYPVDVEGGGVKWVFGFFEDEDEDEHEHEDEHGHENEDGNQTGVV